MKKVLEFCKHKFIGHEKSVRVFTLIRYIGILPIAFDIVFLKYLKDSSLPLHKDVVEGLNCYRFNFTYNTGNGGDLICDNTIFRSKYLNIFKPDENLHGVSKVQNGTRYVLSIGIGITNYAKI